jgi:hypothetical protein
MAPIEQRILLTQASAGMTLSQPVILPNKVALCARGTVLSDALIARLMSRGVKRIFVQGQHLPDLQSIGFMQEIAAMRERFARVRQYPTMANLEMVIERVLVRRL